MKANPRFRLLPMPLHSLLLLLVWLLLNNTLAPGHLVLGAFLAFVIPLMTSGMQYPQPSFRKPLTILRYLFMVLGDIVVANFEVALLVIGPTKKLNPAFIAIPLDIEYELPITILASTVSLTPGTVSTEETGNAANTFPVAAPRLCGIMESPIIEKITAARTPPKTPVNARAIKRVV